MQQNMKVRNAYFALPTALANPDSTAYNPSNIIITQTYGRVFSK